MARSNSAEYDRKYYQKNKKKLRQKHLENYYANQSYYNLAKLLAYHGKRGNKKRVAEIQRQMRLMLAGSPRRSRNKSKIKRSRKFVVRQPRAIVSHSPQPSPSGRDEEVEAHFDRGSETRPETAEISDLQESIPETSDEKRLRIRKIMYGDNDG